MDKPGFMRVQPGVMADDTQISELPIGVFDSGVGGLTVLRALRAALPGEEYLYLGDTARLPYGTKSAGSVARYAVQCARLLVGRGIKLLVVACNTASSVALPALAEAFPDLPVVGVVEPGARAGCSLTRTRRMAVIATESTVRGGAYERAIVKLCPQIEVRSAACPLFVALAEEGWTGGEVAEAVARRYLDPLMRSFGAERPDVLVLGCTHFPVLAVTVARVVGPGVQVVDSAATTAREVAGLVAERGLARTGDPGFGVRLLATDDAERFARVGAIFLGQSLDPASVEIVDL